jgi:phosphoenolpyruvate synthase/pyruvate phosphate dikinase
MPITIPSPCVVGVADISLTDVARVGGKNVSLGELFRSPRRKIAPAWSRQTRSEIAVEVTW